MTAIRETLQERGKTHGDYRHHAEYTQAIKRVCRSSSNWDLMEAHQQETLDMLAHKIGRVLAGDPNFADHWHDMAGYATLTEQRLDVQL